MIKQTFEFILAQKFAEVKPRWRPAAFGPQTITRTVSSLFSSQCDRSSRTHACPWLADLAASGGRPSRTVEPGLTGVQAAIGWAGQSGKAVHFELRLSAPTPMD